MIILAIGSNLSSSFGDRFENINLAITYLEKFGIKTIKKSSFYETYAYPNKKDPKFINVIISTNSKLKPSELAKAIISVEKKLERKRITKNSPRTCDIDIIDYNNKVINFIFDDRVFNVPHEKLNLRNFVLFPLKEILPEWKHPKTRDLINHLIEKLSNEDKNSILKITKP